MNVSHLECGLCGLEHEARRLHNLCTACGKPLLVRYDLERAGMFLRKDSLAARRPDMWRYREVLPVENDDDIVSLGEGWTPLLRATRLERRLGCHELYIKDESQNPTQSFKARGMAVAISMAKELGAKKLAVPSAGNAAGALAAYAARAGLKSFIFMPRDTPRANVVECEQTGAHVTLMDGLITDCGAEVGRRKEKEGWFDVSTLKEPYRVEGKKTLGYELAEQMNWRLPDVIIYPTGGGTGLIGMWKAFDEMERMGWIGSKRPRMVTVQAEGCAPIVRAFEEGAVESQPWPDPQTFAAGIRVPKALGDFIVLRALRESNGIALAVTDDETRDMMRVVGGMEGMLLCPEGAAAIAAAAKLRRDGWIRDDDSVVVFNTGSGLKYAESLQGEAARGLEAGALPDA